jgi:hypothetical protein
MESPEVFDPVDTRGPVGPAFHPIMPIGDQASSGGGLDLPGGPPRLVVFLGHFDDRRSPFCGPDREASCRDRFVVTAVLEVDGESIGPGYAPRLDPPSGDRVDPQSGPGGMRLLMSQVIRPGSRLLSHDPVIGSRLGEVEPGLGDGRLRLAIERVVWVARALDISEQGWIALRTYFVVDGTTNVYEVVGERYVQLEIPVTY